MIEFPADGNLGFIGLNDLADALNGESRQIQLPSFQRDAVWDEGHIELLWDSLWRDYPVGSLLFADVSGLSDDGNLEARPTQIARYEAAGQVSADLTQTEYVIIDGQQRAIAVALGFRPIQAGDPARMWVDLGAGAETLFTVCTRQKPWGSDATRAQINEAKQTLNQHLLTPRRELQRDIPTLLYTWPTRRLLPVPLAGLLAWLENGQSGDWRELAPEMKREEKARDDLEIVFERLQALRQRQLPVYLVRDLSHEQLGQVFQRLNKQGVAMSDQDLFFSALKMKWPKAHNLVWEIYGDEEAGRVMSPGAIVHLAVRLVSGDDHNVPRLNLAEFDRLTKKEPAQFEALKRYLATDEGQEIGRLHALIRRARALLSYDPANGLDDPGLPPVLLARLPWRVWHTLVAWLARHEEVTDEDRREMIRYALLDYYFSGNTSGKLVRLPFRLAWRSDDGFPGFAIYAALWRARQLEKDLPSTDEFAERLQTDENQPPAWSLFKREQRLGLWTQRAYLHGWFPDYDPTRYGRSEDMPYDLDHILPSAFRSMKGRTRGRRPAQEFWHWRNQVLNGPGNKRWWPASLNRSDRHKNLDKKFLLGPSDQETPEGSLLRAYDLDTVGQVRDATQLGEGQLDNWQRGANKDSVYDWRDPERIRALRHATDARRLALYRQFFDGLGYAGWREQFDPWLAATIRSEVVKSQIERARAEGPGQVTIAAKSVAEDLGLHEHIEAICAALDAPELCEEAGLTLLDRSESAEDGEVQWTVEWQSAIQ